MNRYKTNSSLRISATSKNGKTAPIILPVISSVVVMSMVIIIVLNSAEPMDTSKHIRSINRLNTKNDAPLRTKLCANDNKNCKK